MKPCDRCRLLFCDFVAKDCLLTPAQITRLRPDLLRPEPEAVETAPVRSHKRTMSVNHNKTRIETARLGFRKYDARYKYSVKSAREVQAVTG